MAFPSDSSLDLATAWAGIRAVAGRMKAQAVTMGNSVDITRRTALDYANALADYLVDFDRYAAVSGLATYAQEQTGTAINIVTEFNAMRAQLVATQDWLVANFPETTGELRVYSFDANKRFADINLTATQLSAFKTQLTALAATVA